MIHNSGQREYYLFEVLYAHRVFGGEENNISESGFLHFALFVVENNLV